MAAASAAWPSATSPGWSRAPDPARAAAWTPRPARRAVTRLPRTLRLDPSDTVVFERAAEPGEWAVPGGFAFWDEDPAALTGRRRQEFRAGFLGLGSFGWSTLVEGAEAAPGGLPPPSPAGRARPPTVPACRSSASSKWKARTRSRRNGRTSPRSAAARGRARGERRGRAWRPLGRVR